MNRHTCKSLQNARGKGIPRLEISITGCDCFTDIPPNAAYDAVFNPSIRRPRDPSENIFGDSHLNSYLRFDEATDVFFFRNCLPSRSPFDAIYIQLPLKTLFLQT